MNKVAVRNKKTALRGKRLGEAGEKLAHNLLLQNGFMEVQNLNQFKVNFPFADFVATRSGVKFIISVKIRNKYEASQKGRKRLNSRYKLGSNCYQHAADAEGKFKAQAAWLVIAFDEVTFDAYFGLLSSLNGRRGVPMTEKAKGTYECLASKHAHQLSYEDLKNSYKYTPICGT